MPQILKAHLGNSARDGAWSTRCSCAWVPRLSFRRLHLKFFRENEKELSRRLILFTKYSASHAPRIQPICTDYVRSHSAAIAVLLIPPSRRPGGLSPPRHPS